MIAAVDRYRMAGTDMGAMGAALGKTREEKARERAEAVREGRAAGNSGRTDAKVRKVAEEFVSVFMAQVMKAMRATVRENPAVHGDNGEKFFQEMLDGEQAKTLAQGSGYGLTELVYQSLLANSRVAAIPVSGETPAAIEAVP